MLRFVKGLLDQEVYVLNISRANSENFTAYEKEYTYSVNPCHIGSAFL